jgi:hypothetical protein
MSKPAMSRPAMHSGCRLHEATIRRAYDYAGPRDRAEGTTRSTAGPGRRHHAQHCGHAWDQRPQLASADHTSSGASALT